MAVQTTHHGSRTMGNLNRRFAESLGWKSRYHQVKFALRLAETLPGPMEFADAVAQWQSLNPPLKTDGMLGRRTWNRMRSQTRMNAPMSPLPAWLRSNAKTRVRYNVPMKSQGRSPVCWIAVMAMMLSYRNRVATEVSSLTGGISPSNASIPNSGIPGAPVQSFDDQVRVMRRMGFEIVPHTAKWFGEDDLLHALCRYGPMVAFLDAARIYNHPSPESEHAVIITGLNTTTDTCYLNNPWGQKDEPRNVDLVLHALDKWREKSFAPQVALMSLA